MPKLDERIAALQVRLGQLKARQQKADARERALQSRQARKDDTRRKIIAGAIVLAKVEQGVLPNGQFQRWLDESLTRPDDRALFNLPAGSPGGATPAAGERADERVSDTR